MSQKLTLPNRNDRYPGPGSYIRFSEFGVLDPNYKKRMILKTEPNRTKDTEDTKNEESNEYNDFKDEEETKPKKEEDAGKVETKKEEAEKVENEKAEQKEVEQKKVDNTKVDNTNNENINEENPKIKEETKNENEDDKSDCILLRDKLQYEE